MYGNYCGPYWSDGRVQQSQQSPGREPVDDLDSCCFDHDLSYSQSNYRYIDLNRADQNLINCVRKISADYNQPYKALYKYAIEKLMPYQQRYRRGYRRFQGYRRFRNARPRNPRRQQGQAQNALRNEVRRLERVSRVDAPVSQAVRGARTGVLRASNPKPKKTGSKGSGTNLSSSNLRLKGTDFLATIATDASPTIGEILYQFALTPVSFQNSRVAFFSQMYDQYRLHSMTVEFTTQVSTTTNGQIIGFFDPDAEEVDTSNPLLVNKALSNPNNKPYPMWATNNGQPLNWTWKPPQSGRDAIRYCNQSGEVRLTSYGNFYLILNSTTPTSTTLGTLRVKYDIEFITPLLENQPAIIYAAANYQVNSPSTAQPLGSSDPTPAGGSNIVLTRIGGATFCIGSSGYYNITITASGAGITANTISAFGGNTATLLSAIINSGETNCYMMYRVFQSAVVPTTNYWSISFTATTISAVNIRLYRSAPSLDEVKQQTVKRNDHHIDEIESLQEKYTQLLCLVEKLVSNNNTQNIAKLLSASTKPP
jgi:hypothetical protein